MFFFITILLLLSLIKLLINNNFILKKAIKVKKVKRTVYQYWFFPTVSYCFYEENKFSKLFGLMFIIYNSLKIGHTQKI